MKKILAIIILFIFLALPVYAGEKLSLTPTQLNFLSELETQGVISLQPELNKVFIHPGLWRSMKYVTKKNFAIGLAIYCGNKNGSNLYWVVIYDLYSGKKLAKYSQAWGFKVY